MYYILYVCTLFIYISIQDILYLLSGCVIHSDLEFKIYYEYMSLSNTRTITTCLIFDFVFQKKKRYLGVYKQTEKQFCLCRYIQKHEC